MEPKSPNLSAGSWPETLLSARLDQYILINVDFIKHKVSTSTLRASPHNFPTSVQIHDSFVAAYQVTLLLYKHHMQLCPRVCQPAGPGDSVSVALLTHCPAETFKGFLPPRPSLLLRAPPWAVLTDPFSDEDMQASASHTLGRRVLHSGTDNERTER